MTNYYMQPTLLSFIICEDIDNLICSFLWASFDIVQKPHLVSWDKLCVPKKCGGLGS